MSDEPTVMSIGADVGAFLMALFAYAEIQEITEIGGIAIMLVGLGFLFAGLFDLYQWTAHRFL